MGKYFDTEQELFDAQYDILDVSTEDNPSLPTMRNTSANKALDTDSKKVIRAINEILAKSAIAEGTVTNIGESINDSVGSILKDPTLLDDIHRVDVNLIKGLLKVYNMLVGDGEPVLLDESVNSAIKRLNEQVNASPFNIVYDKLTVLSINTLSNITKPPNNRGSIILRVNNVDYLENDSFTIDYDALSIDWVFNKSNRGFDIIPSFSVHVIYSTSTP